MGSGNVLVESLRILCPIYCQLDHTQLEWIVLRHDRCVFHHLSIEPVTRHHPVDQTELKSLGSVNEAAFKQDFLGLAMMDVPRDAEILEVCAQEHGVFRRKNHIHGGGDNPAAKNAIALNRGNSRLLYIAPSQGLVDELFARMVVAAAHAFLDCVFRCTVLNLFRRAEIMASGKMVARAG